MQEADILFIKWFSRIFKRKKNKESIALQEPERKENPFLPRLRSIVEQILEQKGLSYKSLKLLLIDTDTEPESILEEDDMQIALEQLSKDLNFLTILTDRPAYFQPYVETMYEDTGLPVQIGEKENEFSGNEWRIPQKYSANMVLDFEQKGSLWNELLLDFVIYVPIYKKNWEIVENLDICVPIGYNTVIVKGN